MFKTHAWAIVAFVLMGGAISYLTYNFITKLVTPLEGMNQTTPVLTEPGAVKSKGPESCNNTWDDTLQRYLGLPGWEYIVLSDGHRFSIIAVFNLISTVGTIHG